MFPTEFVVPLGETVTVAAAPVPAPKIALSGVALFQAKFVVPSHQFVLEATERHVPAPSCGPAVAGVASQVKVVAWLVRDRLAIATPRRHLKPRNRAKTGIAGATLLGSADKTRCLVFICQGLFIRLC